MKRFGVIALVLSILFCIALTSCSTTNEVSVIIEAMPESITHIEASGNYNGELEPWELTQAEIEDGYGDND